MADISKIKGTDNTVYDIKDATARSEGFNVISISNDSGTFSSTTMASINYKTMIKQTISEKVTMYRYSDESSSYLYFSAIGMNSTSSRVSKLIRVAKTGGDYATLEGVIQMQISGAASTITSSNLTANRALISNSSGKVAVSDATSDDLATLNKLIFKAAKAYAVGDVVLYSGQLFVCASAKTTSQTSATYYPSTSGDTTYWTRVFIS